MEITEIVVNIVLAVFQVFIICGVGIGLAKNGYLAGDNNKIFTKVRIRRWQLLTPETQIVVNVLLPPLLFIKTSQSLTWDVRLYTSTRNTHRLCAEYRNMVASSILLFLQSILFCCVGNSF
jgi:predicted permease